MIGFDQVGTVYTPDPAGGAYTVVDNDQLACRLCLVPSDTAPTGDARAELLNMRLLMWDPAYAMPDSAQVEVDGERWNVRAGTAAAPRGPGGRVAYRRCDVVRAL